MATVPPRSRQRVMDLKHWAVIAAMPAEAATWRKHSRASGVGLHAARAAAERHVADGARGLLAWGTAGALGGRFKPGALLIYTAIVERESGRVFTVDAEIVRTIETRLSGLGCHTCRGASSVTPLSTHADKTRLSDQSAAEAVDMESVAVAAVAVKYGLPFASVRAVVDPGGFSLPRSALAALDSPVHPVRATLINLAQHPTDVVPLIKLAHWYRRALKRLTRAAAILQDEEH